MASRRKAGRTNPLGVNLVFLGVGFEPAHRGLHVINLRREFVFGTKAVLRRNRNISPLGELGQDRTNIGLVPRSPRAAMDHDHRGERSVTLARPCQVKLELYVARLGVDNILFGGRLGWLGPLGDHFADPDGQN